jgi:hypothetical protein
MTDLYDRVAARPDVADARHGVADARHRDLRAVQRLLPRGGAFSHQTAAALLGFGVLPSATLHVTVPAGAGVPRRRGITAHQSALTHDDVVEAHGLRCLAPARCAVDLARGQARPDALAVLDAALRAGACTPESLAAEVARHDGLRGVRQARELIPLADPLARCPQETHMRLLLHDGELPAPRLQLAVVDESGAERYRLPLGYEEARVGIEYDPDTPTDRAERPRTRWLADTGWRMRYFTDDDLHRRPAALVQMVRATLLGPGPA